MARIEPAYAHGIYSYKEVAGILDVSTARVRRWADGYTFPTRKGNGVSAPILQTKRRNGVITFPELIELHFVREFVALSVPLPQVRHAAEQLAKVYGPLPFAHADLLVSGRELLARQGRGFHSEDRLANLIRPDIGQIVADFAAQFAQRVTLESNTVVRYKPAEFEGVYLDSRIRWGEPVATDRAIPTRSVYMLWREEQDLGRVAEYFEIDSQEVSVAVRYHGRLCNAA